MSYKSKLRVIKKLEPKEIDHSLYRIDDLINIQEKHMNDLLQKYKSDDDIHIFTKNNSTTINSGR